MWLNVCDADVHTDSVPHDKSNTLAESNKGVPHDESNTLAESNKDVLVRRLTICHLFSSINLLKDTYVLMGSVDFFDE